MRLAAALMMGLLLPGIGHAAISSCRAALWEIYVSGTKWTGFPNSAVSELADNKTYAGAERAKAWKKAKDGETITTGTKTYRIQQYDSCTFKANEPAPTCPALPGPRTQTCPSGTTGTWTQTATQSAPPACTVTWSPSTAPAGACTTTPTTGRTLCAVENGTCAFEGTLAVYYGCSPPTQGCPAAGAWTAGRNVTTSIACNNQTFGDPIPGVVKRCETGPALVEPEPPLPVPGTALLQWTPPTQNTDGSALTNLAGFRVYWSQSAMNIGASTPVQLAANVTSYTSTGLTAGTWYFGVVACNAVGACSQMSTLVSKVIP